MEGKGQTSLDFAAGMSTFLLVFAFVLSFVPGMFQPFAASDQQEPVVADRIADQLVGGLLGSPGTPYVLDSECTKAFFDPALSDNGCSFDNSKGVHERLALSQYPDSSTYRHHVRVAICRDNGAGECPVLSIDDIPLRVSTQTGRADAESSVASRRVVTVLTPEGYQESATLVVEVW